MVVEEIFPDMEAGDWGNVPPAIRRIWAGERDYETLVEPLYGAPALLVWYVLEALADSPPVKANDVARERDVG